MKAAADAPSWEIVGIVRHAEPNSLDTQGPAPAQFYLNFNQIPVERLPGYVRRLNLLTRTEVEPLSLASAVRAQTASLNKDQAVFNVRAMKQTVAQSVAPRRFSMLLLMVFAVVALGLACLGIYGLVSYTVAQRAREIGVRMALGAQASDVLKLVIGQGMKPALVGVALGLGASLALARTMKALLFGVSATDPLTFAGIAMLLTFFALFACFVPAKRATKKDRSINGAEARIGAIRSSAQMQRYGFRPGRGAHDAIRAIRGAISQKPKWALDADTSKCFDQIDRAALFAKLRCHQRAAQSLCSPPGCSAFLFDCYIRRCASRWRLVRRASAQRIATKPARGV